MNTQNLTLEDKIELLVDGELPEEQRVAFFGAVEATPDGWRRCAVAYVEAQAIGESLPAGVAGGGPASHGAAPWWRLSGIAAAVVAAFLVGRGFDPPIASAVPQTAEQAEEASQKALRPLRPALFRPTVAHGGAPAYSTHEELPDFVIEALLEVGHDVRTTERTLRLDTAEGAPIDLPLVETHIIDMRPQAL